MRKRLGVVAAAVMVVAGGGAGRAGAAPMVEGMFPSAEARVCADTPLRITFSEPPTLGKGRVQVFEARTGRLVEAIEVTPPAAPTTAATRPTMLFPWPTRAAARDGGTLKMYTAMVTGNAVELFLAAPLTAGKSYYVTVDAGAFGGASGAFGGIEDAAAWTFVVKEGRPAVGGVGAARLTVAADGSGDFCTLQGAIDFVPAGNRAPVTITLKNGTYHELVAFSGKHAVTIRGEDRKKTIVAYPNNANLNGRRGLFNAGRCEDLTVTNLTLHNTTPQGGSQAEAIILGGTADARAMVYDVDMYSFQDTLQINGQAYLKNCHIEGDVDFMWGSGPCFFESCTCVSLRSKAYYTQIRNRAPNHGYVYSNCTFTGAPGVTGNFLSRIVPATYPDSEVVLLNCTLTEAVSPVGWLLDKGAVEAQRVHYWEFNSRDAAGKPVETKERLAASRRLRADEDAELIRNYSDPTWVLGGKWTPILPEAGK